MSIATQKANDPAAIAVAPGHGSTNPGREKEMNEATNTTAAPPAPDPLLETIRAYQRGLADFNVKAVGDADYNLIADATYGPHLSTLTEWDHPAASFEGAVEALRISLTEEDGVYGCDAADRMVKAAYDFLKGVRP